MPPLLGIPCWTRLVDHPQEFREIHHRLITWQQKAGDTALAACTERMSENFPIITLSSQVRLASLKNFTIAYCLQVPPLNCG